jgi:hypothetical protein
MILKTSGIGYGENYAEMFSAFAKVKAYIEKKYPGTKTDMVYTLDRIGRALLPIRIAATRG